MLTDATAIHAQRPDLPFVALCDGAPEMRALLRSALDETVLGARLYEWLEFWHLLEKLAAAARVLHGESGGPATLARWRADLLNRNAAPDTILATLRRSRTREVRVGDARPVHDAITYLENHRELLVYPGARRRGLPVGSRKYRSDPQDALHDAPEAVRRAVEGSHRGRVVNLRAGAQ